jgi:predicted AAA+ superfamily ATPase
MTENLTYTHTEDGEVRGEVVERRFRCPEQFGLWVSLHRSAKTVPDDDHGAMASFGVTAEVLPTRPAAGVGLRRSSRSGRVAWILPIDYAGRADALVAC